MRNNLKEIRKSLGMTQAELSSKAGVARTQILMIENNPDHSATARTLEKLASALGVSVGQLIGEGTDKRNLVPLPDGIRLENLQTVSNAEWSRFVLRGLISYHERMTMGEYPEQDSWVNALKYALACVEEKIKK